MSEISYNKEELDNALKMLGKEIRRLGGKNVRAEITIVGGAAIIARSTFRVSTTDIDAILRAPSLIHDAIRNVGEQNGYTKDWINQDFKNTASYSPKIEEFSIYYKTFSNVLTVRTLPPEYLAAMKLAALREYKHDKSDIVGLIQSNNLSKEKIDEAFKNLYGGYDQKENGKRAEAFLTRVFKEKDLEQYRINIQNEERNNKEILQGIEDNYPNLLNNDTVNDILKQAVAAEDRKTREAITAAVSQLKTNASAVKELEPELSAAMCTAASFYEELLKKDALSKRIVDDAVALYTKRNAGSYEAKQVESYSKRLYKNTQREQGITRE